MSCDPTPRLHLPPRVNFGDAPLVRIVTSPAVADQLEGYLRGRDLYLHLIPTSDDDLPTYGVGVSDRALARAARSHSAVA